MVALFQVGCADLELAAGLPSDVSWLAALSPELAEELRTTPLQHYQQGETLEIRHSEEGLRIIGYADQPIRNWVEQLGDEVVAAGPLFEIDSCGPALPFPSFLGEIRGSKLVALDTSQAPVLSTNWLPGLCPSLTAQNIVVHVDCATQVCVENVAEVSPCSFTVDWSPCFPEALPLISQPDGTMCIPKEESWDCEQRIAPQGASVAASCTGTGFDGSRKTCDVVVFRKPEIPHLEIVARAEIGSSLIGPSNLELDHDRIAEGLASDFVIAGDKVFVSALSSLERRVNCDYRADRNAPPAHRASRLYTFDLATLGALGEVETLPCLTHFIRNETGFFGVHSDPSSEQWMVSQFDNSGAVLSTHTFAPGKHQNNAEQFETFAVSPDGSRLIALTTSGTTSQVTILSADTLLLERAYELSERMQWLIPLDGSRVAIGSDLRSRPTLNTLDVSTGEIESASFSNGNAVFDVANFNDAAYDSSRDQVLFLVGGNIEHLFAWKEESFQRVSFFERRMQPARIAPWSDDGNTFLVTAMTPNVGGDVYSESVVALYDAPNRRMLPGVESLGIRKGPGTRVKIDGSGRALILLGWTAELVLLQKR